MRLLRNRKSGVILPWNEYLEKHPDMVHYEEPPAPPTPEVTEGAPPTADIDDLLAGLDST